MGFDGRTRLGAAFDGLCILDAFIRPFYVIQPFSLSTATILVVFTSVTGFVIAFVFGVILNKLHRYQGLE